MCEYLDNDYVINDCPECNKWIEGHLIILSQEEQKGIK